MPTRAQPQPEQKNPGDRILGDLPFPGPTASFLADPYPAYQRMREETPIRAHNGKLYVSRYRDVTALLRDERFGQTRATKPAANIAPPEPADGLDKLRRMRRHGEQIPALWLVNQNPPDHTRLRALLAPSFNPSRLEPLRARIQAVTDSLLDAVQEAGRLDIIADFSYLLPVLVISEILGVPPADRKRLQRWSRDFALYFDLKLTAMGHERVLLATAGFTEYCRGVMAQRGQQPLPELMSTMLDAHEAGKLSTDELLATYGFLFFAGYETTTTLISNGVLALLRHPDQMRRLRADPALITSAVEELLRYDSPTQLTSRVALTDVELAGTTFHKNDQVILMLGAANRDPERFAEPERLDLGRAPNPHVAFGQGIHYCLGGHLARLEAQVALNTILRRLPNLALEDAPLEWAPSLRLRRLKALPARF